MPRKIEGTTYDSLAWDLREFFDKMPAVPIGQPVDMKQTVQISWETSAAKREIFGQLTLQFLDRASKKVLLHVVLVGQFVVDRFDRNALHGDMIGLPMPVWLGMAREIYDTARGLVLAKSKNFRLSGIPAVPDEAFASGIYPNDYGISHN